MKKVLTMIQLASKKEKLYLKQKTNLNMLNCLSMVKRVSNEQRN